MDCIPENSILTPHPGEFKRLVGDWQDDFDRLNKQRVLASERNIIVVLKGAHTSIALPDGTVHFNGTGNPGMATAGSGDVLTGIITGILAQGYEPAHAAVIGVYLHGLAGDLASNRYTEPAMIAGDIISSMSEAYRLLF
jgi:NAD(P)H-hydrate epimerase